MARPTLELIEAIRKTARNLAQNESYQWGHMGSCNCGHLAQEITRLSKSEIHRRAMEKYGDWSEQLNDYCPTSGLLMDDLITNMLAFGLDTEDLRHLERLSDPEVRRSMNHPDKLRHNVKKDVARYLKAWASLLEIKLTENVTLPQPALKEQAVNGLG